MTAAAKLKAEVAKLERRYRGHRYPTALRKRIVTLAGARRRSGASWGDIGAEVGIRAETLRRWCIADDVGRRRIASSAACRSSAEPYGSGSTVSEPPSLVPVRVVDVVRSDDVTLVSPSGWRVEGLDLVKLTALLQSLQ
jgi:hypothetical protein